MAECVIQGEQITDTAYACAGCGRRLETRLREAAAVVPELETTVARLSRTGDPTPRAGRPAPAEPIRDTPPPQGPTCGRCSHRSCVTIRDPDYQPGHAGGLPVDLAASETADAVRNTVTTWARVVADEKWPDGRPDRPAGPWCSHGCEHGSCIALWGAAQAQAAYDREMPPPVDLDDLMRWLGGRADWIRYEPYASEAFDELSYCAAQVWRAIDRPPGRRYLGPCQCGADLYARPGAELVRCRQCAAEHRVADRVQWLESLVLDRCYTAAEISAAYGIKAPTIRKWAGRSQIAQHGHDQMGRPLYLLREVLDWAARVPARQERMAA